MVGANFHSHLEGTAAPAFPMLFLKPPSAVIGHGDTIQVPRIAGPEIDYEAELTVVIGQPTPRVPGDVIMNGTTAYGSVRAGDVVEMTIEGIGTLRNVVADEEASPR